MRTRIPVVMVAALLVALGAAWATAEVIQKTAITPQLLARFPQIKLVGSWVPTPSGTAQIELPARLAVQPQAAGTSLQLKVPGFAAEDVRGADGTTYQRLTIPNGGVTAAVGFPELPTVGAFVEVPRGVQVRVTATPVGEARVLDGYLVWPAQPPAADLTGAPSPPFTKDAKAYATDAFWPSNLVYATSPGTARGASLVSIKVCPVQHNPVTRQIRVYGALQVRVEFVGSPASDWQTRRVKYATPEFAPTLRRLVPTYVAAPWANLQLAANAGAIRPGLAVLAADYLIICPNGWEDTAARLAAWREATGLRTKITKTSDISGGASAANIAAYIKNAYEHWAIPPSYVILIGDTNLIPTHYRSTHPSSWEGGFKTGTDLYYATVDGDDIFPDIALGRLPAATEAQAGVMIDKIINYEQNPPTGAWTSKALVASGVETGRFFHITSNAIADFLTGRGYAVTKVYSGNGYSGTGAQISSAINGGVFLVTHRDHGNSAHGPSGGSEGWGSPSWTASQAHALSNGAVLPVVFSLNCRTGWFDDETDQDGVDPGGDSLCEALIRDSGKGAVGVFGASRISYSGYNDELAKGFIDAIWPTFDPTYSGGAPTGARLGQVLNAGKMWMYDKYVATGGGSYGWEVTTAQTTCEFELFHLFGDPAMRMWTGAPSALHASLTPAGGNAAKVTVKSGTAAVAGALVVIQKPDTTAAWITQTTDASGTCAVTLESPTQQVMVTASKVGYRPFHSLLVPSALSLRTISPKVLPSVRTLP